MVDGATGAPLGDRMKAPGGLFSSFDRVAVTGRGGGRDGVFLASYTVGSQLQTIGVWRVGSSRTATILRSKLGGPALGHVAITSDPQGRLWVLWTVDGAPRLHVAATRSNAAGTRFGKPVDVSIPGNVVLIPRLFGDAGPTGVDAVAKFRRGDSFEYDTTRILARLELKAGRRGRKITATVSYAGDPIQGATVKAGGRRKTTNAKGRAVLVTGNARRLSVSATAPGYLPAKVRR
jgi:hypothetical protein